VRSGVLGTFAADQVTLLFPQGFVGGWRLAVALVLSMTIAGAYGQGDKRRDPGRVFSGVALAALLSLYGSLWAGHILQTLVQFAATVLVVGGALTLSRFLVDLAVRRSRSRTGGARAILVAHEGQDWREVAGLVKPSREFLFVGTVRLGDRCAEGTRKELSRLGDVIGERNADTVLLWGELSDDEFAHAVDVSLASGCQLFSGPNTPAAAGLEPKAVWLEGTPLIRLTAPTLRAWQLALKRATDVIGAVLGLLLLAPVFASVAVAVKVSSSGPVFFRQWRVGRAGKPFEIRKFRSMYCDAENRLEELRRHSIYADERLFKMVDDPRITRVGHFVRKTSIDELPQLMNVLRGEMSLVGPRPPTLSEVKLYEEHHYCRFDMKPGITGPWQVNGRNRVTDFEEVIRLEREYINKWSLLTDLDILVRTLPVVVRMDGAH
jgi:exopolysaccharide biosynthesis polyprenyl glycosylphosphotransferase